MNPYLKKYSPGGETDPYDPTTSYIRPKKVTIDGKQMSTYSNEYRDLYNSGTVLPVYEGLPTVYAPEVEVTAQMTDKEREKRRVEAQGRVAESVRKGTGSFARPILDAGLEMSGAAGTYRFAQDPIKNLKGTANVLSYTNIPGLIGHGIDYAMGNPFFNVTEEDLQGLGNTIDVAGLATLGAGTAFKQGAKQIPKILSYADDIVKTSKMQGKISLPKYTDIYRWQPDEIPEFLIKSGENLTPEQKALTGSWYNIEPQMGFYMRTRPGSGTILHSKLPEYKIKELQKTMPAEAKGMSGKAINVAKSDEYHPNELIVPKELREKGSNPIRFKKNPHEYIKNSDEYTKLKEQILENTGQTEEELVQLFPFLENVYKDDAVNMFLKNLIQDKIKKKRFFNTIPSEYVPFKTGGSVNPYLK